MSKLHLVLFTSILLCGLNPLMAKLPDIIINEFLAQNLSVNMEDDYYGFSDWIELRNTTDTHLYVGGYYLTNDINRPPQWRIPSGTYIPAGGYLIVWADEMNSNLKNKHTNFKIDGSGGYLGLYNSSRAKVHDINYPD